MRCLTYAFVSLSLGLGAFACSDGDGATLAANARWRLRCPVDGMGCLDADRGPHAISAREGDPDAIVACGFLDLVDSNLRALSMEFEDATGRLTIDNVLVNDAGGIVAGAGCKVTVVDEGVTFGPFLCGPEPPSEAQPCQITTLGLEDSGSLVLDDGTVSGPVLSTTVQCIDLADESVSETRRLVSPDSAPPNLMPVPISVANCDGY